MKALLPVYFCLLALVNAAVLASAKNTTLDAEKELKKLGNSCLTPLDFEKIAGGKTRYGSTISLVHTLMRHCVDIIGLSELRSELGFGPMHPWKAYNDTDPDKDELWSAPSVEAYYDLIEPRHIERSLNSSSMYESNTIPAIAFLDERFPVIREVFRKGFREIREKNPEKVKRKIVDLCLEEYEKVQWQVRKEVLKMFDKVEKCWYGERNIATSVAVVPVDSDLFSTPAFNEKEALEKIATSCLTIKDYENLTGNIMSYEALSYQLPVTLIKVSSVMIGLSEMRSILGFGPLHPWTVWNSTKLSEEELAAAPTIEDYYDLKEPRSRERSLNSTTLFPHNMDPALALLEMRFPEIQKIFKHGLKAIAPTNRKNVNRDVVDRCIEEYKLINERVTNATMKMHQRGGYKCVDDVKKSD